MVDLCFEITKLRQNLSFVSDLTQNNVIENWVITDFNDVLQLHNQNIMPSKIDYKSFQPKLAWLPAEVIKKTFKQTAQFYRMPMGTYLKKRYKSPFPACNVHHRSEPVATDTVYSDTPAIDSGITTAQFFVVLNLWYVMYTL